MSQVMDDLPGDPLVTPLVTGNLKATSLTDDDPRRHHRENADCPLDRVAVLTGRGLSRFDFQRPRLRLCWTPWHVEDPSVPSGRAWLDQPLLLESP